MENLTATLAGILAAEHRSAEHRTAEHRSAEHRTAERRHRQAGIVAVTGSPGSGVGTTARLLCTEYGALMMSMASMPRIAHEMTFGLYPERRSAPSALLDFRLAEERKNGTRWILPFHRRLKQILRHGPGRRIVITVVLTPRELAYCKGIGPRRLPLPASAPVRRSRLAPPLPLEPHQGLLALDLLMQSRPQTWDIIVDSDEPYPEFIKSLKAQLGQF